MKLLKKIIFGLIISLPLASMVLVSPSSLVGNKVYAEGKFGGENGNSNDNKNGSNPSDGYKNFQDFADMVVKVFSWFWVVPAILAGKLMSNDFAYGKVFGLDVYLWKMWVIMKTFANYGLGFTFIVVLVKTFFQKDSLSTIRQFFPKLLIAGVLIQSSWFILGALIDISTIMTAAVASVPIKMIKEGEDYQAIINKLVKNVPKECTFNNNITKDIKTFADCSKETIEMNDKVKDYLTPSYKNLDGPLVFLGYAILRFQDMTFLSSDQTNAKGIGLGFAIKAMIIIMFVVPMFVLMFANIIRIFYIWLWVVFSPFIVLFSTFGGKVADAVKQEGKAKNIFNVGELFGLIFQPVAVVGAMSVAFMLVLGLSEIFYGMNDASSDGNNNQNVFYVKNCDDGGSTICGTIENSGAKITFKGAILKDLKDVVGGSLGYLILAFFTIYLVWGIVRIGFHTSKITSGMADSSFNFVGGMIKAAPILPGGASVGALQKLGKNVAPNTYGKRESKQATDIQEKIEQGFGLNSGINSNDMNEIDRKTAGISNDYEYTDKYFDALRDVLSTKKTSFINDPNLGTTVMKWANGRGKQYLSQLGVKLPDNATLEDLLNDEVGRKFVDKALKGEIKDFKPTETNQSLGSSAPDIQKVKETMYGK